MKRTWIIISLAAALASPFTAFANHDKNCKATHGTVSSTTDHSVTVNGKTYTVDANTAISKESGATTTLTSLNKGDKVCIETASLGSKEASKIMVLDQDSKVASSSSDRTYTADTADATDHRTAKEKLSVVERKAHDQMCKGHHGTVTDKTANTITVDGKTYALSINTPVNKQEEPLLPKTVKVGDRVCFVTKKATDGSMQITKLMGIDQDADAKVRVREKVTDDNSGVDVKSSPDKVEVETPGKHIEVK